MPRKLVSSITLTKLFNKIDFLFFQSEIVKIKLK